ncbi:PD-(D/E)XK nuclease superfamily protein [Pseudobutyrivibrio sp. C4]|uniref:PDDEXK-like family protein n=1 Tax=Pseudobutyrivibrio sp. C4 TaxID=1520803 RepID=UPI0008CE472D|nr:PD-(D/E)XK nuclease family protein [Pseudobutyrivibrio sp. C4]SES90676.1 PD-(D/E)XK nuclease superfamily protein [Pseudobutyrivibrio sp. C4]
MDTFTNLLKKASKYVTEYHSVNELGKNDFNIFRIERIDNKEVLMCRFLRELLDPKGSHGHGDTFLKLFVENVLNYSGIGDSDYSNASVVAEYPIDALRRIDLCIIVGRKFIPIEVKIYADDQDNQCWDYYVYAKDKDEDTRIFYLTIDGHEPSESSKGELRPNEQLCCISFKSDISNWLKSCIDLTENSDVKSIIRQYLDVIQGWSKREGTWNKMSEKEQKDLVKEISKSSDLFNAASTIEQAIKYVKIEKMKEVFRAIEKHMERYNDMGLTLVALYEDQTNEFYENNRRSWPSLNYIIPLSKWGIDKNISFRIEIEWKIYMGLTPWSGCNNWDVHKEDIIQRIIDDNDLSLAGAHEKENGNWYWWKYLNVETAVNFRYTNNDEYYSLYDEEDFAKYIEGICSDIDSYFGKLKHILER